MVEKSYMYMQLQVLKPKINIHLETMTITGVRCTA